MLRMLEALAKAYARCPDDGAENIMNIRIQPTDEAYVHGKT